jgi:hypothetical protein
MSHRFLEDLPMSRRTGDLKSEKRPVLPDAGKDAFHSVPLFSCSDALGFHALSYDLSSYRQEVRDAVECVPTRFMAPIRVQSLEVAPCP